MVRYATLSYKIVSEFAKKKRGIKMIVKIRNVFYDSEDEPIMLILNSEEKELITDMGEQTKFCEFPENYNCAEVIKFMKGEK